MKGLAIISIIGTVFLSGCAHYGYQRSYAGYGAGYGYGTGYGVQGTYAYPASVYYPQATVPGYMHHYTPPRYDHGGQRYEWSGIQDRRDDLRNMERRWDRQQHAIRRGVRSGDLTRREADRLQQDARRIERNLDRAQRRPMVSEMQRQRLDQDLDRTQQRIRQFKNNDLTSGGGRDRGRDWGDRAGSPGRRQNR